MGVRSFRLGYDRDYGIDRRSGWSVVVDGVVVVQFVSLLRALRVSWVELKKISKDLDECETS